MDRRKKLLLILVVLVFGFPLATYVLLSPPILPNAQDSSFVRKEKEEWSLFEPISKLFLVKTPVSFQHASETVSMPNFQENVRYNMYVGQSENGTTFMINVIQYPQVINSEKVLDGIMKEMVAGNDSNTILYSYHGVFSGCPSNEFSLKHSQGIIMVRAFLKGNTLYVLSVADRDQDYLKREFESFVESFRFQF